MKNLLVVAVLGLLLGAGAWKLQNPDGSVDDFRQQSLALGERLRDGVEAVQRSGGDAGGATLSRLQALEMRLDELESGTPDPTWADLQSQMASISESVEASQQTLSEDRQSTQSQLDSLALRLDTLATDRATADATNADDGSISADALLARWDERFKVVEDRLETVDVDERRLAALSDQLQAIRDQFSTLQFDIQSLNESQEANSARLDVSLDESSSAPQALTLEAIRQEIASQLSRLESSDREEIQSDDALSALPTDATQARKEESSELGDALSSQEATSASGEDALSSEEETSEPGDTLSEATLAAIEERKLVTREQVRAQRQSGAIEYKIYFDRDSIDISDEAATVLNSFIVQEQNRTTGVSIFGFTDSLGPAVYNQYLAQECAANVRDYLIDNGFDADRIEALNGLGDAAAAELVPAGADSAQQRVVVLFAAQP